MAAFLTVGLPRTIAYYTGVADSATVPIFPRALLTTGHVEGEISAIELEHPLVEVADFVGQDGDFAPLYVAEPQDLAERMWHAMDEDATSDFFMVLEWPESGQGTRGLPPQIGLDLGQEAGLLGRSYVSFDAGVTFGPLPFPFNVMFRMTFSPPS